MTRSRRSPAAANKAAYSASVRSTPPVTTSMLASISLIVFDAFHRGNDCLRYKYFSVRFHRVRAIAQDAHRPFVVPVVNDFLQNISVRARWDRVEKASSRELGMWRKIGLGFIVSQALNVVADLNVADRMVAGERSVDDLAAETGCQGDALYKIMRVLAAEG